MMAGPVRSRILGVGTYLPDRVVRNEDLKQWFDTSDDWIRERTGIEERRAAPEGVNTSDLGAWAAERALANAGVAKEEVDYVIFATLSPDHFFPGSGVYMQAKMGLPTVGVLDIRNQCSGFLYGLAIADAFVRAGSFKRVLLVGAEIHTHILYTPENARDIAVLFGDAGAAVVVGPSEDPERGILSIHQHADGTGAKYLKMDVFDMSQLPFIQHEHIDAGMPWPVMDGRRVFMNAVARMKEAMGEALERNGLRADQIDMLITHQANLRISETLRKSLGLAPERVHNNIMRVGNTTAASIPLALAEALELGKIKDGDLVGMAAFGSGFTWAAGLMRW